MTFRFSRNSIIYEKSKEPVVDEVIEKFVKLSYFLVLTIESIKIKS